MDIGRAAIATNMEHVDRFLTPTQIKLVLLVAVAQVLDLLVMTEFAELHL